MRWHRRPRAPRGNRHAAEGGRVWCPVRRTDVDIDRCFACGSFEDLAVEGEVSYLYCDARPASDPRDYYWPAL